MGHLLSPSLAFLQKVKDIVPAGLGVGQSTFTSFLDDFLVNVFLPQLEDTLKELTGQTTGELDAFQQDPQWRLVAQRPVMKGTAGFLSLITAICRMLDSLPHDPAFSQLIVDLLTEYYDKCHVHFKTLVQREKTAESASNVFKKSAAWVQPSSELEATMREMWTDPASFKDYLFKEVLVFTRLKGDGGIAFQDIISDRKTISQLCVLYNSMRWFSSKLVKLRQVSESTDDLATREGRTKSRRWTLVDNQIARDSALPVYLPLTKDLADVFDGVVRTYKELADTVLFTLRAEARTRAAHYIDLTFRETSWVLENEPADPDNYILTLNSDLVWFDQDISSLLRKDEERFVKSGLSSYMDHLLVGSCGIIKGMNSFGIEKMQLDILVLQQNLKNLIIEEEEGVSLSRSADYYRLFSAGPAVCHTSSYCPS